jgi:hypothetical protein
LGGAFANNFNMGELLDDIAIPREHHPDVSPRTERPGQGGGDGCKPAHADEVVHFRRDKEYLQEKPSEASAMLLCKKRSNFLI